MYSKHFNTKRENRKTGKRAGIRAELTQLGPYARYTPNRTDTKTLVNRGIKNILIVMQYLPSINQGLWTTAKTKKKLSSICYTSLISQISQTCTACMHVVAHSNIQYSINKDINIHILQIHKHTNASCGVTSYCILLVLVQQGLCAAAAVGLTLL